MLELVPLLLLRFSGNQGGVTSLQYPRNCIVYQDHKNILFSRELLSTLNIPVTGIHFIQGFISKLESNF